MLFIFLISIFMLPVCLTAAIQYSHYSEKLAVFLLRSHFNNSKQAPLQQLLIELLQNAILFLIQIATMDKLALRWLWPSKRRGEPKECAIKSLYLYSPPRAADTASTPLLFNATPFPLIIYSYENGGNTHLLPTNHPPTKAGQQRQYSCPQNSRPYIIRREKNARRAAAAALLGIS